MSWTISAPEPSTLVAPAGDGERRQPAVGKEPLQVRFVLQQPRHGQVSGQPVGGLGQHRQPARQTLVLDGHHPRLGQRNSLSDQHPEVEPGRLG